jgi:hypothetical protein
MLLNRVSLILLLLCFSIWGCGPREEEKDPDFQIALENGYLAQEGYRRCMDFVKAWLEHQDPETGLIPRNLHESKDLWNAKDAAADNYPFMVLTAAILDKDMYEGKMREMLRTEQALTNRLDRLPDDWSFSKRDFVRETIDKEEIIFGASEYIKDGLLPLTEYIGETAWSARMIDLLDDIWKHADKSTPFGDIPSYNVEVNGELMQALSRVYWMTGEQKYLDWALRLADYYLLGENHPSRDQDILRLRDHGCEIVSGLCEVYVSTAFASPEKREAYKAPIMEMLDRILEVGTNEHGLFYNQINPITGEILDEGIADTWGYTYNGYYSVYMLDSVERYREALLHAFDHLHNYEFYDWERGSADGYADAIESALNLYNREPVRQAEDWINSEIQVMWSMQDSAHRSGTAAYRGTGIIEGWHGDGNFARTSIMYSQWKTQGTTLHPWSQKVYHGALATDRGVKIAIFPEEAWEGRISFDYPRHSEIFNLPMDYPRINQLPEWFTVENEENYEVIITTTGEKRRLSGSALREGIPINAAINEPVFIEVRRGL